MTNATILNIYHEAVFFQKNMEQEDLLPARLRIHELESYLPNASNGLIL